MLAVRLGEHLRLVHVCEDLRAPVVLGTSEERGVLGAVRDALEAEGQRLAADSGAVVDVHLAAGPVADALVAVAEFEQASFLVVGPGADARPPRVSSVVERVARQATVPTLVVKAPTKLLSWLSDGKGLAVLVGADLGRSARAARAAAATLQRAGTVAATTVSVAAPGVIVDDLRAKLARLGAPDEDIEIVTAGVAPEVRLAALADERDVDVVVVGQRSRSLFDRVWSGSVSRGVLEAVATNVLCVPVGLAPGAVAGRAPDVVVVGVDVDDIESARRAIAESVAVARHGGVVHVATVVDSPDSASRAGLRDRAWTSLARLVERSDGAGCTLEHHVLDGEPASALLALAERLDAAMVVVCGRRRSLVSRALLGSVARGVIDAARVPVLVVPPERP